MTRLAVWIAALGVSALGATALGASAANAQSMTLTSPDIKEGATIANEQVFKGFGCTGSNLSPALSWSGAPSGTKSLAVSIQAILPKMQQRYGKLAVLLEDIPAALPILQTLWIADEADALRTELDRLLRIARVVRVGANAHRAGLVSPFH